MGQNSFKIWIKLNARAPWRLVSLPASIGPSRDHDLISLSSRGDGWLSYANGVLTLESESATSFSRFKFRRPWLQGLPFSPLLATSLKIGPTQRKKFAPVLAVGIILLAFAYVGSSKFSSLLQHKAPEEILLESGGTLNEFSFSETASEMKIRTSASANADKVHHLLLDVKTETGANELEISSDQKMKWLVKPDLKFCNVSFCKAAIQIFQLKDFTLKGMSGLVVKNLQALPAQHGELDLESDIHLSMADRYIQDSLVDEINLVAAKKELVAAFDAAMNSEMIPIRFLSHYQKTSQILYESFENTSQQLKIMAQRAMQSDQHAEAQILLRRLQVLYQEDETRFAWVSHLLRRMEVD